MWHVRSTRQQLVAGQQLDAGKSLDAGKQLELKFAPERSGAAIDPTGAAQLLR